MKTKLLLISLLLSLVLCSCSAADNDSSTPAATSMPETTASSQNDSSSQQEESTSSLGDEDLETLVNKSEDFDTADEFLDSVYVTQYYKDRNADGINYIPEIDDQVKQNCITAYYGCYYIYYTYNGKPMGICVDISSGAYDSAEKIYEETYARLSNTLSDDKEETLSHYRYDAQNDMMICDEKTDSSIGYIAVTNNIGFKVEIFAIDMDSTIDEIIDFSTHLKF